MALLRTTRRLLRAVGAHYANRRRDASLRDCDPRMLKDIGLRWERGKLVPLHPERIAAAKSEAAATSGATSAASESHREVCPRCGARLA
ncbi:DUF1127 domain-containing protein [Billgrantia kenyensis]|uniref:YjiS-like domain-containing protein n=1 Tax=Billgrantia kenyensis TaxID=321266 RepID=A0A7V9W3N1_9GAMM|nr:DUF1127 domain-containing protein [Halomonas kenyensis]MBA2780463.1 hypothetical protein [Halomonas kenyensis]MCG6662377.1 hypothetical protein [Halomonas kenyensis]